MEQKIEISRSDYALDMLARFDHFRKTNKHCDFIIRAGDKEIPVHRFVVSASSEYFDAMLSHDTKENNEGVVVMKEVDPDCVVKCVDFMYTGEAAVAEEKQQDLMHVAHMLQLKRLYNGIAVFLQEKLECSSFFSTREIAKLYDCDNLIKNCNKFAFKNFRALAKLEDFGKLEMNYVEFLLSSEDLKEPEEVKCKALMMWINHDSDRAASLFALMKHIDFSEVSMPYGKFLIENEPAVTNSLKCQNYVLKSVFVNPKIEATDRSLSDTQGIIVLDGNSAKLRCFRPDEKKWNDVKEMHPSMENQKCSGVMIDDFIYVVMENRKTLRLNYRKSDASWEALAIKNEHWGPTVALNGMIYGTEDGYYSRRIERYDPNQDQWSHIPDRSNSLAWSAVVVAGGRSGDFQSENLFLLGGVNMSHTTDVVEQFDPASSSWSNAPSLRQGRKRASATTLNGAIYLFGGENNNGSLQNVEILFPDALAWQSITLSMFKRKDFTSCTIDGKIYLVGNRSSGFQTIDEYDANTRNLKTVATLNNMNVYEFSSMVVPL